MLKIPKTIFKANKQAINTRKKECFRTFNGNKGNKK